MEISSKSVFIEEKPSWFIGSSHYSLSFSSDGTIIAGTMAVNSPNYSNGKVQFWETATGAATSSFDDWSFVVFSPTGPDMAAVVGSKGTQLVKRNSPGARAWSLWGVCNSYYAAPTIAVFRSDGEMITAQGLDGRLCEFDPTSFTSSRFTQIYTVKATSFAYCPLQPDSFIVGRDNGQLNILLYTFPNTSTLLCQLTPVGSVRVSACAWSQDSKWIATGDVVGDIHLWDAGDRTNVSLARLLPRDRSGPITSLIFVPDSTALIIICAGCLTVWDIARGVYVANSGLPAMAKNMALDGPRNRVAVAVDDKISLYELNLLQQTLPGQQNPPHHNRQTQGKPSVSSELAEFDITNKIVKSKPDPFVSIYFDIYRGVWNLDTPCFFQHAVAIKAVRPSFNPRSKAQESLNFEDLLTKRLTGWWNLKHDNLVPLLGISMGFGRFPAMVTSWMSNGLLSEYIKSDEKYDKMQMVIGVARGVAYLHSEGIIHSDIRASSVLVDELGNARLADPGLLSVLTSSPLILSGTMNVSYYRWMAPELLEDSSPKTTFATDVYSVMMTSLEVFTASHPFEGVNDALVPGQVLQSRRPDRPQDVGDVLWSLWNEGWNQNPTKRPDMASYVGRLNELV
ncbi:kinase-like protein [Phlegmacium glaucopus]|nr:kinase-like protein [Phlegmacium glaucopus]